MMFHFPCCLSFIDEVSTGSQSIKIHSSRDDDDVVDDDVFIVEVFLCVHTRHASTASSLTPAHFPKNFRHEWFELKLSQGHKWTL